MPHRIPKSLRSLRRNQRLPTPPHSRRNHHRQLLALRIKHLTDRHQRRLRIQRIKNRLHQQNIHATRHQRPRLLHVRSLHLIKRHHPKPRIIRIRRVRQAHRQRPNRPRHKTLPPRIIAHSVRPLPALPRALLIDLPRQHLEPRILQNPLIKRRILPPPTFPRILDKKLTLRDRRRPKRIRLQNVRPRLQKSPMNIADHLRLRKRKQVPVIQQILVRILEPRPTDIRLRHPIRPDRRPHRPVDDRNPLLHHPLQRMLRHRDLLPPHNIGEPQRLAAPQLTSKN